MDFLVKIEDRSAQWRLGCGSTVGSGTAIDRFGIDSDDFFMKAIDHLTTKSYP